MNVPSWFDSVGKMPPVKADLTIQSQVQVWIVHEYICLSSTGKKWISEFVYSRLVFQNTATSAMIRHIQ